MDNENITEARPPLTLRILRSPASLLILGIVLMTLAAVLAGRVQVDVEKVLRADGFAAAPLVGALCNIPITIFAYWLFVRFVEGRPFSDFALPRAGRELGAGLLLGAGLMSLMIAVMAAIGDYHVVGTLPFSSAFFAAGLSVTSGVREEILARGIIFRQLERGLGSPIALGLSAFLFGLAHIANPHSSWFAGIAIAIEAGILLGAVYMATRRLWAAIGVHAAWNFFQGGVYGVPISGLDAPGLLRSTRTGPDLLTGGGFGAEASIIALVVATAAGLAILWLAWRRGRFIQPFWVRRRALSGGAAAGAIPAAPPGTSPR
jgi:membrane protease YdiL (CAAX protease family)